DCPSDWSSHEEHCYKVFRLFKTWEEAEKFCTQQVNGWHLASIESVEEANFLAELVPKTLIKSKYHVWIGLRDQSERQQCSSHWTDGSAVSYEKVVRFTKCFGLNKDKGYLEWVTLPCEDKNPFICKSWVPH
uniref:Snaclec macrovipecetin subunit alpha n=1 Tax=Macrovipera lebetinus TaxID=3148341 RepID=SLMA_MACLB|nr:RecName: Full=Snaclec macrovipecetin subunit alpha [Macrovipera lebetina]